MCLVATVLVFCEYQNAKLASLIQNGRQSKLHYVKGTTNTVGVTCVA